MGRDPAAVAAWTLAVLAGSAPAGPALGQTRPTGFHPLPGMGGSFVLVRGVSADGRTFVGSGATGTSPFDLRVRAFRATVAGTMNLGTLPGSDFSVAAAVSADGSRIVGESSAAFLWTSPGPMQALGAVDAAVDITPDGAVVLGRTARVAGGGMGAVTPLGVLPGYVTTAASGIAASGAAASVTCAWFEPGSGGGYGSEPTPGIDLEEACRWTEGAGLQGLGFLPGGSKSRALAISADGAVVVGSCDVPGPGGARKRAVRSVAGGPLMDLGELGADADHEAKAASADGSVIVGVSASQAFVWTAATGMRSVKSILVGNNLDMGAWALTEAVGVSDDGLVVVGNGVDPQGEIRAWAAALDQVCVTPAVPDLGLTRLIVAAEGEAAPGLGAGVTFAALGAAQVNDVGTVLFEATLSDGRRGVFAGRPGALAPVVVTGQAGPLGTIQGIRAPVLGDGDTVAYRTGRSLGTLAEPFFGEAISAGPLGAVLTVAQHGGPAPQTGGGTYRLVDSETAIFGPFLNPAGQVAFSCGIDGGNTGVAAFGQTAGGLARFPVTGPAGAAYQAPVLHGYTAAGVMARSGRESIAGNAATPDVVLVGGPPPEPVTVRARAGEAAPGQAAGVSYASRGAAVRLGAGAAFAFDFRFSDGRSALYADHGVGAGPEAVLGTADAAPTAPGETIVSLGGFGMDGAGRVAVVATRAGSMATTEEVLVAERGADGWVYRAALSEGSLVPGSTPCRRVGDVVDSSLALGPAGRILASFAAVGIASPPAQTLALLHPEAGMLPLARAGDGFEITPGDGGVLVAARPLFVGGANGLDGRPAAMSASGSIAYSVTVRLPDGAERDAVVLDHVPVPPPGPAGCNVADVVSIGGFPPPDGELTVDDYTSFINAFAGDELLADVVAIGGFPPPDGELTVDDYTSFINAFAEGCP